MTVAYIIGIVTCSHLLGMLSAWGMWKYKQKKLTRALMHLIRLQARDGSTSNSTLNYYDCHSKKLLYGKAFAIAGEILLQKPMGYKNEM